MFRLVIRPDTVSWDADDGVASGTIFVMSGDEDCPDRDWDDYVVDILSMWAGELTHLSHSQDGNISGMILDFLDGPFFMSIHDGGSSLKVDCIERTHPHEVVVNRIENLSRRDLYRSISNNIDKCLGFIQDHSSKTAAVHRSRLAEARDVMKQLMAEE